MFDDFFRFYFYSIFTEKKLSSGGIERSISFGLFRKKNSIGKKTVSFIQLRI